MNVTGPFYDKTKKSRKGKKKPKRWYLRVVRAAKDPSGAQIMKNGEPVMERWRPYFWSKALAQAEKDSIESQADSAGSGDFVHTRATATEYDRAKKIVGKASLVDVAKFWRTHHPERPTEPCSKLYPKFILHMRQMDAGDGVQVEVDANGMPTTRGDNRNISDLRSRVGAFVATEYGARFPKSVDRDDIFAYLALLAQKGASARTRRNHKNALSAFFGWLLDQRLVEANPAAGIKRKQIGKEVKKEVRFLALDQVERYLRAAERYDPEMVAHEIIQLVAGVRADDEMADFDGKFVLPATSEIVIPAEIAKTEKREVINTVEENFWAWWTEYGRPDGLLRPDNYERRWDRIRVLARGTDQAATDKLARLPIKTLLSAPESKAALRQWPWNGRRRTFCSYHIAKYQSADKTALILRHRGSAYTLHDSYKGTGVTQEQGRRYFEIMPKRVSRPIRPKYEPKGIVKIQAEARAAKAAAAGASAPQPLYRSGSAQSRRKAAAHRVRPAKSRRPKNWEN